MSLIANRPYPIKICYLKNQHKASQQQQEDKVSLTFLSSFIQQEKHSLKMQAHNSEQQSFITSIKKGRQLSPDKQKENAESILEQKIGKPAIHALSAYNKWKKKKSKSQIEQKRLLTNLVGTDWAENYQVPQRLNCDVRRNKKKTIRERLQTFEDDERKKTNNNLMQKQFRTFLSQKKQKPIDMGSEQKNCFVTRMDNRIYQSLNASFLCQFKGVQLRSRTANSNHSQVGLKKAKLSGLRNNNSLSLGTSLKRGFEQIADFRWSKLSGNKKFKLNDHS